MGAAVTAALFTLGKLAIGLYLGTSSVASSYGATGSLVVLLIWVYHSGNVQTDGLRAGGAGDRHRGRRVDRAETSGLARRSLLGGPDARPWPLPIRSARLSRHHPQEFALALPHLILIGIGGALGAIARSLVATALALWLGPTFPFGTFVVNVSGSFAIGVLLAVLTPRVSDGGELRALLVIGFLGAYTTFSTFSYETFALFEGGRYLAAAVNVAGQLALGLVAVVLGVVVARALV